MAASSSNSVRSPMRSIPRGRPTARALRSLMGAGSVIPRTTSYIFDPDRPWKEQTAGDRRSARRQPGRVRRELVVSGRSAAGRTGRAGGARHHRPIRCDRGPSIGSPTLAGILSGSPTAGSVLFVSGGKDFYVVDTRSRKVEKVFSVQRDVIGPPQLTRDGREAYFTRRVTEGDIWLLTQSPSRPTP